MWETPRISLDRGNFVLSETPPVGSRGPEATMLGRRPEEAWAENAAGSDTLVALLIGGVCHKRKLPLLRLTGGFSLKRNLPDLRQ